MTSRPPLQKIVVRVSNPPTKPLMLWDGDCHFCRRWIERWRESTGGAVDYDTSQNAGARFPEITAEQFQRAVTLIEPDGRVFTGAEAVYRSLSYRPSHRWLAWSYERVPGFAAISELLYGIVARNRSLSSRATRLLWGNDVRRPTYFWARTWFLRSLGLIYLIAFVSLWVQVDGLIGANGVLPIGDLLSAARQQLGVRAMSLLPTLCWFNSSNGFLHLICGAGAALSLLMIVGLAPALSSLGAFVCYLSLTIAGQEFLSFQWDILLLEIGFLTIFLTPWRLRLRRGTDPPAVNPVALFLLKLLLFKLMLMSGVVKLTSGDDSWWKLTALDYHYWSQPLPTVFAWFSDKHPEWFKQFSVGFCLFVEIVVPFFIWAPRRPRMIAAGLLVFLQLCIALTGNYCFFNLLTIALCLLLIDDAVLRRAVPAADLERKQAASEELRPPPGRFAYRLSVYCSIAVLVATLPLNLWLIYTAFAPEADWPRPLGAVYRQLEVFRIVNGYGLFRVMTKERNEIVIEGSADGTTWQEYEFKWKPGEVNRAPGWCAPHQPRLDWQMWFAALSSPRQNPWFVRLIVCLLQNKQDVTGLLAHNPFQSAPPRYVRARFYSYRFSSSAEHRATGAWWSRQLLGEYVRPISVDQLGN